MEVVMKKTFLLFVLFAVLFVALSAQLEEKMKMLPAWSSFMGDTKACSDYLGNKYSANWLWGVCGYGYMLNMFPGVCPSGPTAIDDSFLQRNAEVLGLKFNCFYTTKKDPEFKEKQKKALAFAQQELTAGHPVFAWELDIEEFYLVVGADKDGYKYLALDGSVQTCPVEKVGTSDIGIIEFLSVQNTKPMEPMTQFLTALENFRAYQSNPAKYALPGYTQGLKAYDVWIEGMKSKEAIPLGIAYNAQVWTEARTRMMGFLKEARSLLKQEEDLAKLDKITGQYSLVTKALAGICEIYNFPPLDEEYTPENAEKAVKLLTQAKEAETKGVQMLLELTDRLAPK
jgi:hypothetical protein